MQPQNRNVIAFMVLSLLIVSGWMFLQALTHKPPVTPTTPTTRPTSVTVTGPRWPFAALSTADQREVVGRLVGAAVGTDGGFAGPGQLGLALVGAATDFLAMENLPPPTVATAKPATPPAKVEEVTLGNDQDYFIKVKLSTRGGTVRQVVLNRFQTADGYGLPVWVNRENRTPLALELVPEYRLKIRTELTNRDQPIEYDHTDPFYHYELFHFPHPDDARPVDTLAGVNWTLTQRPTPERPEAVFTAEVPGEVRITKTYTLARGDYHVGLSVKLESLRPEGKGEHKFRYQLAGARGLPIEGEWYTQVLRSTMIGVVEAGRSDMRDFQDSRTIAHRFGGERVDRGEGRIQYASTAVQFFASATVVDDHQVAPTKTNFIEWARPTLEAACMKGRLKSVSPGAFVLNAGDRDWTFSTAERPLLDRRAASLPLNTPIAVIWKLDGVGLTATNILPDDVAIPPLLDDVTVRTTTEQILLTPGKAVEHKYLLYNGPVKVKLLGYLRGADRVEADLVERYENQLDLRTLTDYGSYGWWTSLIIFFTNLMHGLLDFLTRWVFPWSHGICIIILTVLVRGVMFPVSRRQARISKDMQEKMAKVAPEVKKLKEKYKDDPMGMYREQQDLFKRNNINQFAMMGGCLPVLAQMPIFMGLYYCLQESILFRLEPFVYMRNLAAPDMLIWWGEWLPMISEPSAQGGIFFLGPYFNLLPVVAVTLMLVQMILMSPPPTDEQMEMSMKMQRWMMVFMGVMFYKVASGLCVYFIASSLWGLAERKLLPKAQPAGAGGPAPEPPPPSTAIRPRPDPKKPSEGNGGFMQKLRDRWETLLEDAAKQQQARRDDDSRGGKKGRKKRD